MDVHRYRGRFDDTFAREIKKRGWMSAGEMDFESLASGRVHMDDGGGRIGRERRASGRDDWA